MGNMENTPGLRGFGKDIPDSSWIFCGRGGLFARISDAEELGCFHFKAG